MQPWDWGERGLQRQETLFSLREQCLIYSTGGPEMKSVLD